jgi:hypothetical protein
MRTFSLFLKIMKEDEHFFTPNSLWIMRQYYQKGHVTNSMTALVSAGSAYLSIPF